MTTRTSVLIVILLTVSSILTTLPTVSAYPTVTLSVPKEGNTFNTSMVHFSGTAAGSYDTLLVTSEANFAPGIPLSTDVSATKTGEVVLFFTSEWQKLNGGNPVLMNSTAGKFDEVSVGGPTVVNVSSTYHMWYNGADATHIRIGHATSPNGITWTRQNSGNAVINIGGISDIDSFQVKDPMVMKEGTTYHMWYSANDGLTNRIAYASSTDGNVWTKTTSAVLDITGTGKFDRYQVEAPSVLKFNGSYHMWYAGTDETDTQIGYATSTDGKTWTRQNGGYPVFSPSNTGFDLKSVTHPEVIYDNSVLTMYYVGFDGTYSRIGRAVSSDGIAWTRIGTGVPILALGTGISFDTRKMMLPTIIPNGPKETMWYAGENTTTGCIGMAEGSITDLLGEYISPAYEFGGPVVFGTVDWNASTPAGTTLVVKVRTSADKGTWTAWTSPTKGSVLQMAPNSYLQFKVEMSTDDRAKTPAFQDFTLNYFKPVEKVEVSKDGLNWYPATGTDTWTADLDFADGNYTVHVRSTDVTTGRSQIIKVNITVDSNPPTDGSVAINDNEIYTNKREVTLDLNATDFSPIKEVDIAEDPMFNTSVTRTFKPTMNYTLTEAEGIREIFVRFRDIFDHTSTVWSDTIILDMTLPKGNITIADGANYTSSKTVGLAFAGEDENGVVEVAFSDDPALTGAMWVPSRTTGSIELKGKDGEKSVYVGFKDPAGNIGIYEDAIILDTVKPTGSILINNGQPVTISLDVNLTLEGKDNYIVESMRVSDKEDMTGVPWIAYSEHTTWHLPGIPEEKDTYTVYVAFKDGAGLESLAYKDYIDYEPMELNGTVVINNGAIYTNSNETTITINANNTELVGYMMVSDKANFAAAEWLPLGGNLSWAFEAGDGKREIFVKFMDTFGMETAVYTDAIILDMTLPEVYIRDPAKMAIFPAGDHTVGGQALDNMGVDRVEVCISTTENCTSEEAWVLMTGNETWNGTISIPEGGTWYIHARAWDLAGNNKIDTITVTVEKSQKAKKSPGLVSVDIIVAISAGALVLGAMRRKGRWRTGSR